MHRRHHGLTLTWGALYPISRCASVPLISNLRLERINAPSYGRTFKSRALRPFRLLTDADFGPLLIVCTSRAGPRQLDYRSLADITLLKRRLAMEAGGRNAPRTIWYRIRYPARSRGLREPDMP